MLVKVMSRNQALVYRQDCPWVHVSITDPSTENPDHFSDCPWLKDGLLLKVFDLTPIEVQTPPWTQFAACLATTDDVRKVLEFVLTWREVDTIVSCDRGVSRSAAMANLIIQYLNFSQDLFCPPYHQPNPWIQQLAEKVLPDFHPS